MATTAKGTLGRRPSKADLAEVEDLKADETYAEAVLSTKLPWDSYVEGKLLSPSDAGMMKDYEELSPEDRKATLAERGSDYAALFMKVLRQIHEKDAVQYMLTLVDQLLETDPSRAHDFLALREQKKQGKDDKDDALFSPLMSILTRINLSSYIMAKTTHIMAMLIAQDEPVVSDSMDQYLHWIVRHLSQFKGRELYQVLASLKVALRNPAAIPLFVMDFHGLEIIAPYFDAKNSNTQLLYVAGFIYWLISFSRDEQVIAELKRQEVVRHCAEILKTATRDKVVRIVFATLKNLLAHENAGFVEEMVGNGLVKVCSILSSRRWKDSDILVSIQAIAEVCQAATERLSSVEMYVAELSSGELSWTPVHEEKFWRENYAKFEDGNYALLKKVIGLLGSIDDTTLEVACYDLGEFARFCPDGKQLLTKFNGKAKLLSHMQHKNPKVAKSALLAVQKIMVQNWEFLSKGGAASK